MALTSQPQHAGFSLTLELHEARLLRPSWVQIRQVRTLAVEKIGKRLTAFQPEDLPRVIEGLNEIISSGPGHGGDALPHVPTEPELHKAAS